LGDVKRASRTQAAGKGAFRQLNNHFLSFLGYRFLSDLRILM